MTEQIKTRPERPKIILTQEEDELEAMLLGDIVPIKNNPLLATNPKQEIRILGDFEIVEKKYKNNKKQIDDLFKYYKQTAAYFSANAGGCCGGHALASQSNSESTSGHENHEHCACGGHFKNGTCEKCGKRK